MHSPLRTSSAAALVVLALTVGLHSASGQAPAVEFSGIQIIAKTYGKENEALRPFQAFKDGVKVALLVTSPAGGITGLDLDAGSAIEVFTDDKGTKLHMEGEFQNGFGSFPQVSPDGKAAIFTVEGTVSPAPGATRLTLKGKLGVKQATKKETVKGGAVKKGAKLTCGKLILNVKSMTASGGSTKIELQAPGSMDGIVETRWLDAAGKPLEAELGGSGRFGSGNSATYSRNWEVKGTPAAVEFVQWADLKAVSTPFAITVNFGAGPAK